jgi:hypothetical protein
MYATRPGRKVADRAEATNALAQAGDALAAAKAALRDAPSPKALRAAEQATADHTRAALMLEAHQAREHIAREALEKAVHAADVATFVDEDRRAAPDYVLAEIEPSIDRLVALEKEVGAVVATILAAFDRQRLAAHEAANIGPKAGVAPRFTPLGKEVAMGLCGVSIDRTRRAEKRHNDESAGDWLAPLRDPWFGDQSEKALGIRRAISIIDNRKKAS